MYCALRAWGGRLSAGERDRSLTIAGRCLLARPSEQRLAALFELYSNDFARYRPQLKGRFGCPLCTKHFGIPPNTPIKEIVAPDHIVPKALGGTLTTLTCRKCNDTVGSRLEKHLIQRVLVSNRKRPIKIRVKVGGAEQGAELHGPIPTTGETPVFVIKGVRQWSDEREVEKIIQALKDGAKTIHFTGNLGFARQRSDLALLRAAYLMMFRTFGYSYVLDSSATAVRAQLDNPRNIMPILSGIMWSVPEPAPAETHVAIVTEPEPCRCFLVLLELHRDPRQVAGVVLPGPGSDGLALYDLLRTPSCQGEKMLQSLSVVSGFLPLRRGLGNSSSRRRPNPKNYSAVNG